MELATGHQQNHHHSLRSFLQGNARSFSNSEGVDHQDQDLAPLKGLVLPAFPTNRASTRTSVLDHRQKSPQSAIDLQREHRMASRCLRSPLRCSWTAFSCSWNVLLPDPRLHLPAVHSTTASPGLACAKPGPCTGHCFHQELLGPLSH
jgi:hypothetical protein